ncbi:MAG TPA: YfiR family protein [Moraxellaceae bacterium]|nr:YfiR family protein [Moraxellaceae bacterium]
MRTGIRKAIGTLGLAAALASAPAFADSTAAAIKAAFVYNFAKFVEWPAGAFGDPRSPLELCVAGPALDGRLQQLEGREAQGHPIRVRAVATTDAVPGCHILVLGDLSPGERGALLQASSRGAILTIGDSATFPRDGGMIGLFVAANRVQFSVNLAAAQGAGLKLSARMLQLAHSVQGGQP